MADEDFCVVEGQGDRVLLMKLTCHGEGRREIKDLGKILIFFIQFKINQPLLFNEAMIHIPSFPDNLFLMPFSSQANQVHQCIANMVTLLISEKIEYACLSTRSL